MLSICSGERPATAPGVPLRSAAAAERTNPKKVRVIFWADGFTVEEATAEEAEEAAKAAAPAAPRRAGLATLGSAAERAAARPEMPKLPPLRKPGRMRRFATACRRHGKRPILAEPTRGLPAPGQQRWVPV